MSGKPTGVVILAILQLISALLVLYGSVIVLMLLLPLGIFAIFGAIASLLLLIVGIIGLILFYGLWTLKSWAWFWALIANLLSLALGLFGNLADITNLISIAVSAIIVVYLLMPGIRDHFR
jgi:uncharacterized membrane protein (DUF2068 family)